MKSEVTGALCVEILSQCMSHLNIFSTTGEVDFDVYIVWLLIVVDHAKLNKP